MRVLPLFFWVFFLIAAISGCAPKGPISAPPRQPSPPAPSVGKPDLTGKWYAQGLLCDGTPADGTYIISRSANIYTAYIEEFSCPWFSSKHFKAIVWRGSYTDDGKLSVTAYRYDRNGNTIDTKAVTIEVPDADHLNAPSGSAVRIK
jgi:predicted small lipoprotein YifL